MSAFWIIWELWSSLSATFYFLGHLFNLFWQEVLTYFVYYVNKYDVFLSLCSYYCDHVGAFSACCFGFKNIVPLITKRRHWCVIFYCHGWTASINPRLFISMQTMLSDDFFSDSKILHVLLMVWELLVFFFCNTIKERVHFNKRNCI